MEDKEHRVSEYEMLREALANLSAIAESDTPTELVLEGNTHIVLGGKDDLGTQIDSSKRVEVLKHTFKYILEYLRRIYNKEKGNLTHNKAILQGIQTIMVLVGEAANKLDRYTSLFKRAHGQTISELKEYKDLQDFYLNKIVKPSQERLTLLNVPAQIMQPSRNRSTVEELKGDEEAIITSSLSDLQTVKDDTDYELFFLAREDGSRFFNSSLVKEMQKACQAGMHLAEKYIGDDPFLQVKNWEDKQLQSVAMQALAQVKEATRVFYTEALKHQDMELVSALHRALMALMLGSSPRNMLRHFSVKSCYQYFVDFQQFLKQAMHSQEYYKLLDHPPRKTLQFLKSTIDILHGLCLALYTHVPPRQEIAAGLMAIIEKALLQKDYNLGPASQAKDFIDKLQLHCQALEKIVNHYPNGPILKALDLIIDQEYQTFDPLQQGYLPETLFDFYLDGNNFSVLNVASPTTQRLISKALIVDEFKGFLRSLKERQKQVLVINLQDRTSWKEHARCQALEDLQKLAEFSEGFTCVTMAKDTDFYYQMAPYQNLDEATLFIAQLQEHIQSVDCGFYFPPRIEYILGTFLSQLLPLVHQAFFDNQPQLTRRQRLDFIEIVYAMLQMKLSMETHCNFLCFVSKDGIDTSPVASVQLFCVLKILKGESIEETALLEQMIFAPALLHRERMVEVERFQRMINLLKAIQNVSKDGLKDLLDLLGLKLQNMQLMIPKPDVIS